MAAPDEAVYELLVTTKTGERRTAGPFASHAEASAEGLRLLSEGSAARVVIDRRVGGRVELLSLLSTGQRPSPNGRAQTDQ
jgi:hypothetical protein